MTKIVKFPKRRTPVRKDLDGRSAMIVILPVVRIERPTRPPAGRGRKEMPNG